MMQSLAATADSSRSQEVTNGGSQDLPNDGFPQIDLSSHVFLQPRKEIHNHDDLSHFLRSRAHSLIVTFLNHLSTAVTPPSSDNHSTESYHTDSQSITVSPAVQGIIDLVKTLEKFIDEAPPESGPRRFGNVAFRKWYTIVEQQTPNLLQLYLPTHITQTRAKPDGVAPVEELRAYLLGGFGSAQRLDFGTGHELSFFAFLCGVWVMGGFERGKDELGLILRAFDTYLGLVRRLIITYNLEPAGTHGVWGLDDHSFLPYVFGSAQLSATPEGLGPPAPGCVVNESMVERERNHNMYLGAVGFIRDVKKGPFWEHSPYLFDISGVAGGWKKINKGMLKMYSAEVLGKFPVVQHFPLGSIFSWELATSDPNDSLIPGTSGVKSPWSTVAPNNGSNTMETTRIRTTTPPLHNRSEILSPTQVGGMRINNEPTPVAPVLGGTAPTIAGIPVTTAPWARPPTGPGGAGYGAGGGIDAMPPPAMIRSTMAPHSITRGERRGTSPGIVGSTRSPPRGGRVSVASEGSLAGGRVTEYSNAAKHEEK